MQNKKFRIITHFIQSLVSKYQRVKKYFLIALAVCTALFTATVSCNKLNVPTGLGQDLIPSVDNIETFETALDVQTYNGVFDPTKDTFRMEYTYPHVLGMVDQDPVFGKTDSRIFLQVSPGTYPFKNRPGSTFLDSVILVLTHRYTYGDTLLPQTVQVSEMELSNDFRYDTSYQLNKLFTTKNPMGTKIFTPNSLKDTIFVFNYPDTIKVAHQLRIRIDNDYGNRILAFDSTGIKNYDSVFRTLFKGLAIRSVSGGKTLLGFPLIDASNSSNDFAYVALYYRYVNPNDKNDMDTTVVNYPFYNYRRNILKNANANYIHRDYGGTQVTAGAGDEVEDPVVYIQNNPGTYTKIKVPGLANLKNCVVHLAELKMEGIYDPSDTLFFPSPNVFLDVYDPKAGEYKLMPYDLGYGGTNIVSNYKGFYSGGSPNYPYYYKFDPFKNQVKELRFNMTRYVQHIVSNNMSIYDMRLYAPSAVSLKLGDEDPVVTNKFSIPQSYFLGFPGFGRYRIGGGNHPTQKMKLRIVYSKLK